MEITKVFSSAGSTILNEIKSKLPIVCGVPEGAFADIPDNYKVRIHSVWNEGGVKNEVFINAWLQEKISLKVESRWISLEQLMEADARYELADTAANFIGRSLRSSLTTNRKWAGSSPVQLAVKFKFEAMSDVRSEVLIPCLQLQALVLPRGGVGGLFFFVPPGPNPFKMKAAKEGKVGLRGDNTTIRIGEFLLFNSIIIDEAEVIFENRMAKDGPVGATVNLIFSTYQMLTRKALEEAYQGELSVVSKNIAIGQ